MPVNSKLKLSLPRGAKRLTAIQKRLTSQKGVNKVTANAITRRLTVYYDSRVLGESDIITIIKDMGVDRTPIGSTGKSGVRLSLLLRSFTALALNILLCVAVNALVHVSSLGELFAVEFFGAVLGLSALLLLFLMFFSNHKQLFDSLRLFFHLSPTAKSYCAVGGLLSVGMATASVVYMVYTLSLEGTADMSLYHTDLQVTIASIILLTFSVNSTLEALLLREEDSAAHHLRGLIPSTATAVIDGETVDIDTKNVRMGDILEAKAGERLVADGIIVSGYPTLDESALTGSAEAVIKQSGDRVYAGTVSTTAFQYKVIRVPQDTLLEEEARRIASSTYQKHTPTLTVTTSRLIPLVAIAILCVTLYLTSSGDYTLYIRVSVATLLFTLSAPAPLMLLKPLLTLFSLARFRRGNITVRDSEAIWRLAQVSAVIVDKNAILTEDIPTLTDISPTPGVDDREILSVVLSLTAEAKHRLADSVALYARTVRVSGRAVTDCTAPEQGIIGTVGGKQYRLGSTDFMKTQDISYKGSDITIERLTNEGKFLLLLAEGDTVVGIVAFAEKIKSQVKTAWSLLGDLGCTLGIISGDSKVAVDAVAVALGTERRAGELFPKGREHYIADLQQNGEVVALLGEGTPNMAALVRADVGMSHGSGTITDSTSDIVLDKGDLMDAVEAIQLGKRAKKLFYRSVCIVWTVNLLFLFAVGQSLLGFSILPLSIADNTLMLYPIFSAVQLLFAVVVGWSIKGYETPF